MRIRPRAVAVVPEEDYLLRITFDTGECRIFNVKPYLSGSWYGQLRNPEIFRSVRIAGLSVEWPGGQDICPDCLYEDSVPVAENPPAFKKLAKEEEEPSSSFQ